MPMISPQFASQRTETGRLLLCYFRSGWAFLIPYLVAYLLYASLKWPVNPVAAGSSPVDGGQWTVIPCLLYVYWFLHGLHVLLAALALRAWWQHGSKEQVNGDRPLSTVHRQPCRIAATVYRLLPWIFLGLLFYIPGVYLEFPADPWQHYGRVNEWAWLQNVTEHSAWKKSSYFLGYSLIGQITPPMIQLQVFDFYYTGSCMLLCWQYFRLTRSIGLGERASLVFVLLNALTFGNNIFGFYRYYGMSSSLFAQLGAVALTRIALETAKWRLETRDRKLEGLEFSETPSATAKSFHLSPFFFGLLRLAGVGILLLPLIAFNHVQGLGWAALGAAAVTIWRLIAWRRTMAGWIALAVLLLSIATILWWPRHHSLQSVYLTEGWLTPWYGFNFFSRTSPTFTHAGVILGLCGAVNMLAGLWLLRHNALAGWLTILPIAALCLPCVAIPFATVLEDGLIFTFHRMLLAIPAGLALVVVGARWLEGLRDNAAKHAAGRAGSPAALALLLVCGLALVTVPADGRYFNRLFHALMIPPADLAMRHVITSTLVEFSPPQAGLSTTTASRQAIRDQRARILTTKGIGYVMNATGATLIPATRKWMTWPTITPPSSNTPAALEARRSGLRADFVPAPFPPIPALYSAGSLTGYLSGHLLPFEVALEHAAQPELFAP